MPLHKETKVWGVVGLPGAGKTTLCEELVEDGEHDIVAWERDSEIKVEGLGVGSINWVVVSFTQLVVGGGAGIDLARLETAIRAFVDELSVFLEGYVADPKVRALVSYFKQMSSHSGEAYFAKLIPIWSIFLQLYSVMIFLNSTVKVNRGKVKAILFDHPNLIFCDDRAISKALFDMEGLETGLLVLQTNEQILDQSIALCSPEAFSSRVGIVNTAKNTHDAVQKDEGWKRLIVVDRQSSGDVRSIRRRLRADLGNEFTANGKVPLLV